MTNALISDDERFRHCLEIQRRVSSEHNLGRLAQLVMSEVTALLGADRSTLFLFDWDTMELRANFAEQYALRADLARIMKAGTDPEQRAGKWRAHLSLNATF